jgi:hypothetical protein
MAVGCWPRGRIAWSAFEDALYDGGFPATACIPRTSTSMPSLSRGRSLPHSRGAKRSTAEQADLHAPTSITTLLIGRAKPAGRLAAVFNITFCEQPSSGIGRRPAVRRDRRGLSGRQPGHTERAELPVRVARLEWLAAAASHPVWWAERGAWSSGPGARRGWRPARPGCERQAAGQNQRRVAPSRTCRRARPEAAGDRVHADSVTRPTATCCGQAPWLSRRCACRRNQQLFTARTPPRP